jgi:hypothetical protein
LAIIMRKFILSILFLTIGTYNMFACQCDKIGTEQAFKKSDIIFIGQVVEIKESVLTDVINHKGKTDSIDYIQTEIKFKIKSQLNGENTEDYFTIFQRGGNIADCRFDFYDKSEYLVYAYYSNIGLNFYNEITVDKYLTTNRCLPTKSVDKIKKREMRKIIRLADKKE